MTQCFVSLRVLLPLSLHSSACAQFGVRICGADPLAPNVATEGICARRRSVMHHMWRESVT